MITNNSDFKGTAFIPNVTDVAPDSDLTGEWLQLEEFIKEFETEALVIILGYELYKEFSLQLETDGTFKANTDQKWIDLLDGKENYRGMRKAIIHYIFFKYLENDEFEYNGAGIASNNPKGTTLVGPLAKAVKAWRIFYEHVVGKLNRNIIVTNSFGTGIIYQKDDGFISTRQFIDKNLEDYPNKSFTNIENINQHGI